MRKEIEELLKSETSYRIAKDLGINARTVNRYQNGESPIDNMSFGTAEKLYNYYLEGMVSLKTITVEKTKKFNHVVGATWTRDYVRDMKLEFLDELNSEFTESQSKEIADIKNKEVGNYVLENGDFDYYVDIKEGN